MKKDQNRPPAGPQRMAADAREEHDTKDRAPVWQDSRVTKTMWPPRPGTIRYAARHGPRLVCVRYRQDATGLHRYTTIELAVDNAPVKSAKARHQRLEVAIAFEEVDLRARARRLGAKWNPESRVWELSGHAVQQLELTHRARRPRRK